MLTNEQIILADKLIKRIKTFNYSTDNSYYEDLEKEGYDYFKVTESRELLVKLDLFYRTGNSDYIVKLTTEGNKAAEVGIENYFSNKEKQNKKSKAPIIISIIALCLSAIDPAIKLKETIFPKNETKNRYYQGENTKEHADSIISQILSDSIFIEKIENSIKHDTIFLYNLKK